MKYVACLFFIFSNSIVWSKDKSVQLSSFQNQINDCKINISDLQNVKNFSLLYSSVQKKYLLISEKIIYQELFFRIKNENRKIKVTNDNVEIFKIDKDDVHTPILSEARQKNQTTQMLISKLILNTNIEKNWKKSLEIRENGFKFEIVRIDDKITQFKINSEKNPKILDCQIVNSSEICLCNKP